MSSASPRIEETLCDRSEVYRSGSHAKAATDGCSPAGEGAAAVSTDSKETGNVRCRRPTPEHPVRRASFAGSKAALHFPFAERVSLHRTVHPLPARALSIRRSFTSLNRELRQAKVRVSVRLSGPAKHATGTVALSCRLPGYGNRCEAAARSTVITTFIARFSRSRICLIPRRTDERDLRFYKDRSPDVERFAAGTGRSGLGRRSAAKARWNYSRPTRKRGKEMPTPMIPQLDFIQKLTPCSVFEISRCRQHRG